ncbi:MAG: Oxidoreductase [Frankiales bacterium]|nr:Oxidoreductase [Frankiales bacterium]
MTTAAALPPTAVRALPRTPTWWRDATLGAAAASLVFVVALWLTGGGLSALTGAGTGVTSLGRLAGLVGSDLLLIQVLLMARVPIVERSFGQDALARAHRVVGFTSFNLVLAHILLVLVGYAALDHRNIVSETVNVVWTYPGMLLATAGFAALVMVVITSVKAARAQLRYESWHLLHLYAYLGVGLALPHQLWSGSDFVTNPLARVFWWTAWGVTAATVLAFRVGLPLLRNARHHLVVDGVVTEAPGVVSVHLRGRDLHALPVRAGQFFVFRFHDGQGWSRGNPYSLSSAPDGRTLRITVKDLGDGSRRLAGLRPGTRAFLEGPYGRLTADARTKRKVAVLAAGIGITPALSLLQETGDDAVLVYRTRKRDDPLFADELDALQRKGIRLVRLAGPRAQRPSWLPKQAAHLSDAEALHRLVPDLRERDLFICGGTDWVNAAEAAAKALPKAQVHVERFSW